MLRVPHAVHCRAQVVPASLQLIFNMMSIKIFTQSTVYLVARETLGMVKQLPPQPWWPPCAEPTDLCQAMLGGGTPVALHLVS